MFNVVDEDGYSIYYASDNPELVDAMRGVERNQDIHVTEDDNQCSIFFQAPLSVYEWDGSDEHLYEEVKSHLKYFTDGDSLQMMAWERLVLHAVAVCPPDKNNYRDLYVAAKFENL